MSAKGSSTFSVGLTFGSPFALSAGGPPEAEYFGAPSDGGAEAGGFGAGRAAVATFVTVGAAGGAVLAGATAGSVFAGATAGSCFSGRNVGEVATGDEAGGLAGPRGEALSLSGPTLPRFGGGAAGTIGGGIPGRGCAARGCVGRGSGGLGGGELAGAGRGASPVCAAGGGPGAGRG
jgi:hypothetical protein